MLWHSFLFLSAAEKPAGQIPNLGPKEECGTNTSTRPQADFAAECVGVVKENKVTLPRCV